MNQIRAGYHARMSDSIPSDASTSGPERRLPPVRRPPPSRAPQILALLGLFDTWFDFRKWADPPQPADGQR